MNTEKPRLEFDPKHDLSYGYWTCSTCKASFYWGGKPLHKSDCSVNSEGYDTCVYHFGPKELAIVKKKGSNPLGPRFLSLENLTRFFPELIR